MARTATHTLALGLASIVALASLRSAAAQSSPPGPANPGQPAAPQAAPAPRPAAPAQPNRALNTSRPVQAPAARPQPAQPAAPRAQSPVPQQVPQPVPQQAAEQMPVQEAPQSGGYSNPGGLIDSTALQTEATQGVHYHYHYYGAGAVVSNPGYGQAGYVNPATAPVPDNPYLAPIYGPGNPAPMNTLMGANNDNYNGRVGGGLGGAAAAQVGGQAWSYGGGIGHWNPYAYGGNGYVEGFND